MGFYSIIIPTYNSEQTIGIAIESILKQSYYNFEIIIVDGVSKDNTINILNSYRDDRILVFSEPDNGIYDAMNKGINHSSGNWLYFLGSDDSLFDAKVLENVFEEIESIGDDIEMVYGNVIFKETNRLYDGEFDFNKLLHLNICHQSMFFKKQIFEKLIGFDLKYKVLADQKLNFDIFLDNSIKTIFIKQTIAYYSEIGTSGKSESYYSNMQETISILKACLLKKIDVVTKKRIEHAIGEFYVKIFLSSIYENRKQDLIAIIIGVLKWYKKPNKVIIKFVKIYMSRVKKRLLNYCF